MNTARTWDSSPRNRKFCANTDPRPVFEGVDFVKEKLQRNPLILMR
jgi:hypothetical protein